MRLALIAAVTLMASTVLTSETRADGWKAGVGRAVITPTKPLWMAGYATREHPAEGKLNDLWCKSMALEDASGKRVLLVTLDLCGIDRKLSNSIRDRLQSEYKMGRESIAISCSHTHSGPMVGDNLRAMNFLTPEQQRDTNEYTAHLAEQVVATAGEAIKSLAPAKLAWTLGTAEFAVNRRENEEKKVEEIRAKGELKGPVDHDLPVMTVTGEDGKLVAVLFGYACHATTTSLYEWSGDWPGVASTNLEKAHPGTQVMCWIGCAGDQNPLPRKTYKRLAEYGKKAADAVEAALGHGEMKPIEPAKLVTTYNEIDLPFAELPTKEKLEADLQDKDKFVANRAKILLGDLAKNGQLPAHYPYPVEVWRLGGDVKWVLLGGEAVVDYSLRLKKELGAKKDLWVESYTNDVMAYIPSRRVLNEGRYEGEQSMVYYCQPTKWGQDVEELIVKEVRRQIAAVDR